MDKNFKFYVQHNAKVSVNNNELLYRNCVDTYLEIEEIVKMYTIKINGFKTVISVVNFKRLNNNNKDKVEFKENVPVILLDQDVVDGKYPELTSLSFNFNDIGNLKKYTLNQILTAFFMLKVGCRDFNIKNYIFSQIHDYYDNKFKKVDVSPSYLINLKKPEMINCSNLNTSKKVEMKDYDLMNILGEELILPFTSTTDYITNIKYYTFKLMGRDTYSRIKGVLLLEVVELKTKNIEKPRLWEEKEPPKSTEMKSNAVNHLDENTLNNSIVNLEIISYGKNQAYSRDTSKIMYILELPYSSTKVSLKYFKDVQDWIYNSKLLGIENIYELCNKVYEIYTSNLQHHIIKITEEPFCIIDRSDTKNSYWEIFDSDTGIVYENKLKIERNRIIAKLMNREIKEDSINRLVKNILHGELFNIDGHIYVRKVAPPLPILKYESELKNNEKTCGNMSCM